MTKPCSGPNIWDKGPWISFDDAEPIQGQDVVLADPLDGRPGMGQTIYLRWTPTVLSRWAWHLTRIRYWRPALMELTPEQGWVQSLQEQENP